MKAIAFIIGLSTGLLNSCSDNLIPAPTDGEQVFLTGRNCKVMQPFSSPTLDSLTHLATGSRILVHATGSLQLDQTVLTYRNNRWEGDYPLRWSHQNPTTQFTAIYPVYPDSSYHTDNLYSHHTLADILVASNTYPTGSPIHLKFNHLFSCLNLHLAPELQNQLQKIEITCPYTVTQIDPSTTHISLSTTTPHTTTLLPSPTDSLYSVLVPPSESCTFHVRITTAQQTYHTSLSLQQLRSGESYTYRVKTTAKHPGIETVADWIAFSYLLNHPSVQTYQGKTLDDFRKTEQGITTYYLLNDLDFTGINPELIQPIAVQSSSDRFFPYVFDGQGHTLSNLTLHPRREGCGIFAGIHARGCLKNVHVKNSQVIVRPQDTNRSEGIGILAGTNQGIIHNCSVEDCQIQAQITQNAYQAYTGSLVGICTGNIYNCEAHRIRIDYRSSQKSKHASGGLTGFITGIIYNSYASELTLHNANNYTGGIYGAGNHALVENCYLYHIVLGAKKGLVAGETENCLFRYIYYENSPIPLIGNEINSMFQYSEPYQKNFTNAKKIPVYILLNLWIHQIAPKKQLGYVFLPWKTIKNQQPAVLVY